MPISICDNNFYKLTKADARDMDNELNAHYPNLERVKIDSDVYSTFFENHIYLLAVTGMVVFSTCYFYNQKTYELNRGYLR